MTPIAIFLEHFDVYIVARDRLRNSPDGSEAEQDAIKDCADRWRLVCEAREAVS